MSTSKLRHYCIDVVYTVIEKAGSNPDRRTTRIPLSLSEVMYNRITEAGFPSYIEGVLLTWLYSNVASPSLNGVNEGDIHTPIVVPKEVALDSFNIVQTEQPISL